MVNFRHGRDTTAVGGVLNLDSHKDDNSVAVGAYLPSFLKSSCIRVNRNYTLWLEDQ